jgi:hypothetical protein
MTSPRQIEQLHHVGQRALRTREHLTVDEVERLIEAAKDNRYGHRDALMVLLAFRHGPAQAGTLGPTYRREAIATSRSALARISTEHATWSNDSSIRSNNVGGSRRAMTSSRPTTWPSSSSHQYGCGCVLMSPCPSGNRLQVGNHLGSSIGGR